LSEKGHRSNDNPLPSLSPSDWDRIIEQSVNNGVGPLLYQSLEKIEAETDIPDEVLLKLRKIYLVSALRNLRLYQQLSKILSALQKAEIPVIVLKGACLAEKVYCNIALRPMVDIDLLVRKDIDRPTYPFTIRIEGLWERCRQSIIADFPVLILSPEDSLLHICVHDTHPRSNIFFKSICDIAKIIHNYQEELKWDELERRAHQGGMVKYPVYLMLLLTRDLLGAAIPDNMLDSLKPKKFNIQIVGNLKEKIFSQVGFSIFYPLFYSMRFQDKARLAIEQIFINRKYYFSKEFISNHYSVSENSLLIYYYYLIHPKYLILLYGRGIWNILCHYKEMRALERR